MPGAGVRAPRFLLIDDVDGAVRSGVAATFVTILGIVPMLERLPGLRATSLGVVLVAAGLIAAAVVVTSRVRRMTAPLFVAWVAADLVCITVAVCITGVWDSPLLWLYVLPIAFFASIMTSEAAVVVVAVSVVLPFLGGAVVGAPVDVAEASLLVAILAATGLIVAYLSDLLWEQLQRAELEGDTSARRAQLLGITTRATRTLFDPDTDAVIAHLLRATSLLGFGGVLLYEGHGDGLTCRGQVGLDDDWVGTRVAGVDDLRAALVAPDRAPSVIASDTELGGRLRAAGFEQLSVSTVTTDGVELVLVAASRRTAGLTQDERDSVDSLAHHAALALRSARRLEAETRACARESELLRQQRDFLVTTAHELRTPLTVLHGSSELLAGKWDALAEADRRRLVERGRTNTAQLVRLVERLGALESLRMGEVWAEQHEVDLAALIADATESLDGRSTGHLVTTRVAAETVVLGDQRLLAQALAELVGNALLHTPAGTHVHVDVSVVEGGLAEVAVADDGPGIDPDELGVVVEAFRRSGPLETRSARGVGIGLALVQHIAELHDSSLEVAHRPVGFEARLRLPLRDGLAVVERALRPEDGSTAVVPLPDGVG